MSKLIVGVDEAGRGPLAGPLISCALYLKNCPPFLVKDSKKTTPFLREEIFSWLVENAIFSLGWAKPEEIDKINILNATFLSFERAIKNLLKKHPYLRKATFIIDGNNFKTNLKIRYICKEKADENFKEVSCASIVAKFVRDHLMKVAHFVYPEWKFLEHKGYPTKEHILLMQKYNLTPLHRRSFFPCKDAERRFLRRKSS
jgi:ribonuclease HII